MRRMAELTVLALIGCAGGANDSDGDGIPDDRELDLGLDPNDRDSDGDGLDDGDELDLGADPKDPDSDADTLLDGDEVDLGTDPTRADTDDDRLLDPDELDRGTDPTVFDTDGDGYGDGDELNTDHDPLDAEDRIYLGGWPYNPHKGDIEDPGFSGRPITVGETFPRFDVGVDQFGQVVDLYDFGGTDVYTIVDASAPWCQPCQITSSWMAGGADPWDYELLYAPVRAALDEGRLHWVTILTEGDRQGIPATADDVRDWDEQFPHPRVPVMTDPNRDVQRGMNVGETYGGTAYPYWPSFIVVDGDMKVVVRGFSWDAFEFVMAELAADAESEPDSSR